MEGSNCYTETRGVKGLTRASRGDLDFGHKAEGEALRNIIIKLSDERNLKDFHLKHCQMSTAQFKQKTTHWDTPGRIYDLHQHAVKTCPYCNSIKPRPEGSRVSGLRAEEIGDLIFLDHWSAQIENKTFGFLIVLDGATSHLTGHPCRSTSPSEVMSKLHEWIYGFPPSSRHAGILPNARRKENSNRTTAEMGLRLFKIFLLALIDTASTGSDHSGTDHSCPVDAQSSDSEKYPNNLEYPEQLTPTPTKQDLLNEEIQKLTMRLLEVQQREDIRRDLAERMQCVPSDLRAGENVFYWQEDPSKIQQGRKSRKWLKVEIVAINGFWQLFTLVLLFQANVSKF